MFFFFTILKVHFKKPESQVPKVLASPPPRHSLPRCHRGGLAGTRPGSLSWPPRPTLAFPPVACTSQCRPPSPPGPSWTLSPVADCSQQRREEAGYRMHRPHLRGGALGLVSLSLPCGRPHAAPPHPVAARPGAGGGGCWALAAAEGWSLQEDRPGRARPGPGQQAAASAGPQRVGAPWASWLWPAGVLWFFQSPSVVPFTEDRVGAEAFARPSRPAFPG